jgi:hypothetical protein
MITYVLARRQTSNREQGPTLHPERVLRWTGRGALFGFAVLAAACTTQSITSVPCTPVNNLLFRLTPCTAGVVNANVADSMQVYASEAQIPVPYQVVGTIHVVDPGKYENLSSSDAVSAAQEHLRELGANAMVIDNYRPIYSGIFSRGFEMSARALRVGG